LSVIPNTESSTVTLKDLDLKGNNGGVGHCVIVEGYIDKNALKALGKEKEWLISRLKSKGIINPKQVLYFIIDDSGNEFFRLKNI
jgi:uncharacterized membrane protein YcaP (DUF421 family)